MSSSLLLQQCPACLVRRTCIVFVMGGKCPYSWSLVGCCRQDLFNTARAASTDIPDPLSPFLPIVHRLWQVFRATSRILTELLYVCSSWSSCFCSSICRVHRSTSLIYINTPHTHIHLFICVHTHTHTQSHTRIQSYY